MFKFALLICTLSICTTAFCQPNYKNDFKEYWDIIHDNFAYFDLQKTNWKEVKARYQPAVDTIKNRNNFIRLLEKVNHELYNGHVSLNTNLHSSNRLIPSGADIWLAYTNKKFIISSVRQGYNAERSGLKPGMQVIRFNDQSMDSAVAPLLPMSFARYDSRVFEYAANILAAGTHDTKRKLTVKVNGEEQTYFPDNLGTNPDYKTLVESKLLESGIGYIRINNSLGNTGLIKAFDSVLNALAHTKSLIIDLRETPGGGNTTVARAIMGRFVETEQPFQKHSIPGEEKLYGVKRSWLELVTPRGWIYKKPMVVLVNRWTGSMGEGIAIGFDGLKRAQVVGDRMAGLLGANYSFTLTESKIGFSFPAEKLFHINGMPRENFIPAYFETDPTKQLNLAMSLLKKASRENKNK